MITKNKKLLMLASAMVVALPITAALAVTTNMNAVATFYTTITLTPTTMDFSKADASGTPAAAGDFIKLGTNNAAIYGGVFSAHTGAAPAAGTVTINTGTIGQTVEVRCDQTATMTDGATGVLGITGIEVATNGGAGGAFGSQSACNGVGGAAATTKVLAGGDVFKFGGKIDGSTQAGAWVAGAYSTAGGGNDIQVDIIYQ